MDGRLCRPSFVVAVFVIRANAALCFWEEIMKKTITLRRILIILVGMLFAAYSAFFAFVIIKDRSTLPLEGYFIGALVVLLFGVLSGFAWTSEVKNLRFLFFRRIAFISALLVAFAIRLRLVGDMISFLDFSKLDTILYGSAYFATQVALLILVIDYTFIRKDLPLYPRASVLFPVSAIVLFLCSFVMEIILLLVYHVGLEASFLRTVVSRPIFYLGFIGLSAFFLFPPQIANEEELPGEVADEIVMSERTEDEIINDEIVFDEIVVNERVVKNDDDA